MADKPTDREALSATIDSVAEMLRDNRIRNSAVITVQAGGVGVWIATSSAVLMFVLFVVAAFVTYRDMSEVRADVRELRRENQTMRDYLAAIYAQAPHLKPAEKSDEH